MLTGLILVRNETLLVFDSLRIRTLFVIVVVILVVIIIFVVLVVVHEVVLFIFLVIVIVCFINLLISSFVFCSLNRTLLSANPL